VLTVIGIFGPIWFLLTEAKNIQIWQQ